MERKRFKERRICSSENYKLSREVHYKSLLRNHENFKDICLTFKNQKFTYSKFCLAGKAIYNDSCPDCNFD